MPAKADNRARSFSSIYIKLGNRLGQRLFDEVSSAPSLRPKLTPAKILAYVVAGAIHALTLAFAALGIWLIAARWPSWLAIVAGVLCLLVALMVAPRPPHFTERGEARAEFPAL